MAPSYQLMSSTLPAPRQGDSLAALGTCGALACSTRFVVGTVEADYLVVGAGAAGMAFTDALIEHADVRVALVDRRPTVGGHWVDAYPFVRLHQASSFYGVASTPLGHGRVQASGPEAGLHERATGGEVRAYYERVLERMRSTGRVEFHGSSDYLGDGRFASRVSGQTHEARAGCRIVDARYVSPDIPATTPPPFDTDGARVVPVNDLPRLAGAGQYVVVGSGKTATDAVVWLLENGVDPDRVCWVRPRDPWMLNRAVVQPDPAIFIGMAADTMQAAIEATSLDDFFLRLEAGDIMLRIDPGVTPTMAKTPTLARWELDLLRSVGNVVRMGHVRKVGNGRLVFADGEVPMVRDAVVVHCAAAGLQYPPLTPIWGDEAITLQPVRAGFPCFGAALAGYVEATRDDDAEKNRLCPPSPLSDSLPGWARMQVLGARASAAFTSDAEIKQWADRTTLNPARTPPESADRPELVAALDRLKAAAGPGLTRLAELAGPAGRA